MPIKHASLAGAPTDAADAAAGLFGGTEWDEAHTLPTPAEIGAAASAHNHDGTYSPISHNHDGTYEPPLPSKTGNGGKFLAVNTGGTAVEYVEAPAGGGSPSDTVVAETAAGASAAVGSASTYARGDHTHGTPALPTPAAIGAAAAVHNHDAAYAPASKGVTGGDAHDHSGGDGAQIAYSGLAGLPTLGTAAALNVPASGNAAAGEIVKGNDARLSDARTPTAHAHTVTKTLSVFFPGDAFVRANAVVIIAGEAMTVTGWKLGCISGPTGAAFILDVHKNGTTLFTTQGNRPTIAAAATSGSGGAPDVIAVAAGDKLTIDVDQVGSTLPGTGITVTLTYTVAV